MTTNPIMKLIMLVDNMFGVKDLKLKILYLNTIIILAASIFSAIRNYHAQQTVYFAWSVLQGHVDFYRLPDSLSDVILFENRYYWHLPPLHAVLLIPFVYLFGIEGENIYGPAMHVVISVSLLLIAYKFAKVSLLSSKVYEPLFAAFAFSFASVEHLNFQVGWMYYTLHALASLNLLLSLLIVRNGKYPLLAGFVFALAFISRYTVVLLLPYFVFAYRHKFKNLLYFLVFPTLFFLALVVYNKYRFGNFFDFGYRYTNNFTTSSELLYELTHKGLFKLTNIPTNFYYYFIKTIDPNREDVYSFFGQTHFLRFPYIKVSYPGVGFFVVSPIFLLVLKFRPKFANDWVLLTNTLFVIVVLLSYYWSGWVQVGPRYMNDVMPFLYLMFLDVLKRDGVKGYMLPVVVVSAYINLILYYLIDL